MAGEKYFEGRLAGADLTLSTKPSVSTLERTVTAIYRPVDITPEGVREVSAVVVHHLTRDEHGKLVLDREGRRQFTEERIEQQPRLRPEFSARDIVTFAPRRGVLARIRGLLRRTPTAFPATRTRAGNASH